MIIQSHISTRPHLEHLLASSEGELITNNLKALQALEKNRHAVNERASAWIETLKNTPLQAFDIQRFLQAYPLTREEGRALMSLAEAFLRIPDSYTANLLIKDKISKLSWRKAEKNDDALIGLSRWGLDFVSTLQSYSWGALAQPITLKAVKVFMSLLSREFILGGTIESALKRRMKTEKDRFSFDMLGEGARTYGAAKAYKLAYAKAIRAIGKQQTYSRTCFERDSISVKLSALHPHYVYEHRDQVLKEMVPDLIDLCLLAQENKIALTIDAEEANRLELSLDVMEKTLETKSLKGWDGFGFALQAYQKRAPAVIDWAQKLTKKANIPCMVRLVKGAYWDTEIKIAQENGYPHYPVFTRKAATDLAYLACSQKLLEAKDQLFPQFATHNALTVASILHMARGRTDIEFQRLQGMGKELYSTIRKDTPINCRIYAPVGDSRELLPYLVRRLLENGANSSFVHKIFDKELSTSDVLGDPFAYFKAHKPDQHHKIPLPRNLYGKARKNSQGYDLSNPTSLKLLKEDITAAESSFGTVKNATLEDLDGALKDATTAQESWNLKPASERAEILNKTADLLEERRGLFLGLLLKEGKKTLADAIAELREAADFCRYYGAESLKHFGEPQTLTGPTGELDQLSLHGRGIFACISPWNFPLAIFMGQVTAALAAGNGVIAKPASQTPLLGHHAIKALHDAGIPKKLLHLLPGPSKTLGDPLIKDARLNGVVFTGSTSTAQHIQKTLAERGGPIIPFIAETGGLNAMIVDSSALIEQVVDDVIASAFQSAGQRCSALRILFIQEDIYKPTIEMLKHAMEILNVNCPEQLSTDVGPVIDQAAKDAIEAYIRPHKRAFRTPLRAKGDSYVAPTLIEVSGMKDVTKEVFGPVLHVASFKAKDLLKVVKSINDSGYGLTMGIQSRIGDTIQEIRSHAHVGNLYANRTMIGAVVGVQPFGGEGLSGTGPKAGGPYYLPRFAVERTFSYDITSSGGNVDLLNLED